MRAGRVIVFWAALALGVPSVVAGDFEEGVAAFEKQRDWAKAVRLLRPFAEQGNARAQFIIGTLYSVGPVGVPPNSPEAIRWLTLSAEQHYSFAQFDLCTLYRDGYGVIQDYVQAHKWCNLAAAQGHQGAILYRDELAKKLLPEDLTTAQKMARDWLEEHPPQ